MKKFINDLKNLINKKNFNYLLIMFFLLIVLAILEFVGIGSIPFFIGLILDSSSITQKFDLNSLGIDLSQNNDKKVILILSIGIICFFLFKNLFLMGVIYFQGFIIANFRTFLASKIFDGYLNAEYLFFLNRNSSILIRTMMTDVPNVVTHLFNLINMAKEMLVLIAICILLLIADPIITLIIISFFGLFIFIFFKLTNKKIYERSQNINYVTAKIIKTITESIGSIKEIKLFNIEKRQSDYFYNNNKSKENKALKIFFISQTPKLFLEMIIIIMIMSIIMQHIISEKEVINLMPFLTLLAISAIRLVPSFNGISNCLSTLKKTKPNLEHIKNELVQIKKFNKRNKSKKEIIFNKNINLKNINFTYPKSKKNILKNFNLKINSGDKIGIIGKSGTGKTTLVNILLGLIKPTKGQIFIDNVKIDHDKYFWNSKVGYVPQEVYILEDTVKNNIAFGVDNKDIKISDVVSAAKSAQVFKFIKTLPQKFNSRLDEMGHNISVGQKQRLGIARVLYRKPKLIVLDEVTSSLDLETENKFVEDIFSSNKNQTIIFISHKLSALRKCNKIYDLNKSKFIKK